MNEICEFVKATEKEMEKAKSFNKRVSERVLIFFSKGSLEVIKSDWLIKEIDVGIYIRKNSVFEKTYDVIE